MIESNSDNTMKDWLKEHVKCPPPLNVTEDQRQHAKVKIDQIKQLKISKHNLS